MPSLALEQAQQIWEHFQRWTKINLDLERTINVPQIGNFQYKTTESDRSEKFIHFYPSQYFLNNCRLKYRGEVETMAPTIKISFQQISKLLGGSVDKSAISSTILGTFHKILDILAQTNSAEIDMAIFGKLSCYDKTLTFESTNRAKP